MRSMYAALALGTIVGFLANDVGLVPTAGAGVGIDNIEGITKIPISGDKSRYVWHLHRGDQDIDSESPTLTEEEMEDLCTALSDGLTGTDFDQEVQTTPPASWWDALTPERRLKFEVLTTELCGL